MATTAAQAGTRLAAILNGARASVQEAMEIEMVVDNGDGTVDVVWKVQAPVAPAEHTVSESTQETFRFTATTHAEPSARPGTVA